MTRFADCFPDRTGAPPLCAVDWMEFGVALPYVIFFTGRCGSALLNGWLAATGLCGRPDEYFNENRALRLVPALGVRDFPAYFHAIIRESASYGRFGVTVDPFRFPQLPELIDLGSVFPRDGSVFFWLTRRDVVGQAWSYAKAKRSGLWHEFSDGREEREPPLSAGAPGATISDRDWWRELVFILNGEQRMERYFVEAEIAPYRLDYETLIADKTGTVTQILQALSCFPDEIARVRALPDRTRRHRYDDWDAAQLAFRERYLDPLAAIDAQRQMIDVDRLCQELMTEYSLPLWE